MLAKQYDLDRLIWMIFDMNSSLIHLNNQKASGKYQLNNLTGDVKSQQQRVQRKKYILVQNYLPLQSAFSLSCCKASKRKASLFSDETPSRSEVRQYNESYIACPIIYGGSDGNKLPVLKGMLDTVSRSFKEIPSIYYSQNVIKNKNRAARESNRYSLFQNKRLANYLPYKELAKYISSLDIGMLKLFSPYLVETNELENIPAGLFRDIKTYIQRLAIFYMKVNKCRSDKLLTFLFLISFGGYRAPGVGTIFNISFLNAGKRILSSSETFMVFEENSLIMKHFVGKAIEDFIYLESKVFLVSVDTENVKVEFKLAELPNDMKMLSFLAGELSNSAKYFTTFPDVNSENYRDYTKSFGIHWKSFLYSKRVEDSKKVVKKKQELKLENKSCNKKTSRGNT